MDTSNPSRDDWAEIYADLDSEAEKYARRDLAQSIEYDARFSNELAGAIERFTPPVPKPNFIRLAIERVLARHP